MIGALYRSNGEQFVSKVDYKLYSDSPMKLWGELRPSEFGRVDDGEAYVIELEDKRKCRCYLEKRVNAAVSVIPGCFVYTFRGTVIS